MTLRYELGTLRRRAARTARRVRARLRRTPPSPRIAPRPQARRGAPRLRLARVLVASDANARYLDYWPLARRAWRDVAGLEPVLVLVIDSDAVPPALTRSPDVHVFEPLPGVHTALQAQCIRMLYPALLPPDGGVLVSDIDLVPLSRTYFHRAAARIPEDHFVAYRDVLLSLGEIPVCYNAALPHVWGDVFGVAAIDDVRARLAEWTRAVTYDGVHGGSGWTTDQRILFRTLGERGRVSRDVWILDDDYTRFLRLERASLAKHGLLDEHRRLIAAGRYADFHCLSPHAEFAELNERVVELAIARARGRR